MQTVDFLPFGGRRILRSVGMDPPPGTLLALAGTTLVASLFLLSWLPDSTPRAGAQAVDVRAQFIHLLGES